MPKIHDDMTLGELKELNAIFIRDDGSLSTYISESTICCTHSYLLLDMPIVPIILAAIERVDSRDRSDVEVLAAINFAAMQIIYEKLLTTVLIEE